MLCLLRSIYCSFCNKSSKSIDSIIFYSTANPYGSVTILYKRSAFKNAVGVTTIHDLLNGAQL